MKEKKDASGRRGTSAKWKWLIGIVLVGVLAAAALLVWNGFFRETGYDRYQFDTDAMEGRIQRMSDEEIRQELDRVVEEGMFNISIASSIVFESPDGEGQARIENIEENRYHMQVDIVPGVG